MLAGKNVIVIMADQVLIKEDGWDFPVEEIGYLLEEHAGEVLVYKDGRLYETI